MPSMLFNTICSQLIFLVVSCEISDGLDGQTVELIETGKISLNSDVLTFEAALCSISRSEFSTGIVQNDKDDDEEDEDEDEE